MTGRFRRTGAGRHSTAEQRALYYIVLLFNVISIIIHYCYLLIGYDKLHRVCILYIYTAPPINNNNGGFGGLITNRRNDEILDDFIAFVRYREQQGINNN